MSKKLTFSLKDKSFKLASWTLVVCGCLSTPVSAADVNYWIGTTGKWFDSKNWSLNAVPTNDNKVDIGNNTLPSNSITDSVLIDSSAAVADSVYLGNSVSATLTVAESGVLVINDVLAVGNNAVGTLNINGGEVNNVNTTVGFGAGSAGSSVSVSEHGVWNNQGLFEIGNGAQSSVTVESGGIVNAGLVNVGGEAIGTIQVTGTGSQLNVTQGLELGYNQNGTGNISVEDFATLDITGAGASIGGSGIGNATVNTGATWNSHNALVLGSAQGSEGTFNITEDSKVNLLNQASMSIGVEGTGTVLVDHSILDITGDLIIAERGTANGTLNIQNEGNVRVHGSTILSGAVGATSRLNIISNSEGLLGTLATSSIYNGDASASVLLDGGRLRALSSNPAFINVSDSPIQLGGAGGYIDSNNFDVGTSEATVFSGTGPLVKEGAGTLTLAGSNTYTGNTLVNVGTLALAETSSISSSPKVVLAADTILHVLTGGEQVINDIVSTASSTIEIDAGSSLATGTSNSSSFDGLLLGSGEFIKQGTGKLTLTNNNTDFTGDISIRQGTLEVSGTLPVALVVRNSGVLQGTGTVGATTVYGTIAPGSLDTLTVAGDYTQEAGSTYQVGLTPSQSDSISVQGTTTLNGGTLKVMQAPGVYVPGSEYVILSSTGAISGTYAEVTDNLPFLDLSVSYDLNHVYLSIIRNNTAFASFAVTANEIAAANAAESLGIGNSLYHALSNISSPQEARVAFNNISGEIHASVPGILMEDSRYVRDTIFNRLQPPVLSEAAPWQTESCPGKVTVGLSGFGSWGHIDSDGNAAHVDRNTQGLFLTADKVFDPTFRIGLLAGYTHSDFDVNARGSDGDSDNYHVGLYGGKQMGRLGVRLGGAYTWNDLEVRRNVQFPQFSDYTKSSYSAHTAQGFGELAYLFTMSPAAVEPFARLAYVNVDTDAFTESGNAAALKGQSSNMDMLYSTLGIREGAVIAARENLLIKEKISLGWNHAYDSTTPSAVFNFASGSIPMPIKGAPIAEDSLLIDAGLTFSFAPKNLSLRISYVGQVANNVQDHGVVGLISYRFS